MFPKQKQIPLDQTFFLYMHPDKTCKSPLINFSAGKGYKRHPTRTQLRAPRKCVHVDSVPLLQRLADKVFRRKASKTLKNTCTDRTLHFGAEKRQHGRHLFE